ncbi:MAG: ATPase P [Desulfuromonas sp. SDB]|nr:MAG: ATPase P [Desulfuromonas sp. SDB]
MIEINIPSREKLKINHLVCDFNGTLAVDGILMENIIPLLMELSKVLKIHIITADTFGNVEEQTGKLTVEVVVIPSENQDQSKLDYVKKLGASSVIALGNGYNDKLMLKHAAIGICPNQTEGCSVKTLINADIVCSSAEDALNLLLKPKRLMATLRN